nr:hypothetical protein [Tanacetum cinerariifolium]
VESGDIEDSILFTTIIEAFNSMGGPRDKSRAGNVFLPRLVCEPGYEITVNDLSYANLCPCKGLVLPIFSLGIMVEVESGDIEDSILFTTIIEAFNSMGVTLDGSFVKFELLRTLGRLPNFWS